MAGHPALQAMITPHGPAAQALAAADEALIRAALSGELSDEDIADGDPELEGWGAAASEPDITCAQRGVPGAAPR